MMFRQRDIEEYQRITAPTELKDQVKFAVKKARKARKKKIMFSTAAAGIALFLLCGSLLGNSRTILSVNDVVVSQEALPIENQNAVLLAASVGQQRSLPIHIPMEITVGQKAQVKVNVGTLMQVMDDNSYSAEATKIDISEHAVIYWILSPQEMQGDTGEGIVCTIQTGIWKYQYVAEYQSKTGTYTIRKK